MKNIALLAAFLAVNFAFGQIVTNEIEVLPDISKIELNTNTEITGNLTATGSISTPGGISSGNLTTSGIVKLNKGLEVVGIREYSGANTFVDINIAPNNKPFHATITVSGQQLNSWNRRFMWHGIVTWDAGYPNHNLYTLSSENTSPQFINEGGWIKLRIHSQNTSFHYVLYRGQAFISKGG